MSKSGFSTLNRWLGRKNKDKSVPNGKLSKSSTNLSISTTNINETSQLEYNRITPLPAATTNAPFEQTFRITVLLPKDQLYVTRLGARIPLSKLLELVCDNKLLDAQKYEFRNPVDPSQVYSCDLTIGAVGLSEVRLCLKTEPYDSYSNDEIMKLHRSSIIRESLTSSEFSSRNSKHTTKTTSPYSSSNSLNSMDSSGVNYSRVLVAGPPKLNSTTQPKMAAPPRKKRAAPRPPSQTAIPEKSPLIIENDRETQARRTSPSGQVESPLAAKDFSISTPNLASSTLLHSDINGNECNGHMETAATGALKINGYTEDTVVYAQVQKKNTLNLNSASVQNLATSPSPSPSPLDGENNCKFPEPSPRKKIVVVKKKMVAPPAPQPRSSMYSEDGESIGSAHLSSAPSTPVAVKTPLQDIAIDSPKPADTAEPTTEEEAFKDVPKPQPRITTTTTTLLNATDVQTELKNFETDSVKSVESKGGSNVSKVLLNRTPTPEPRSLSCESPDMDACYETHIEHLKQPMDDDNISKQADSGIGEPVPSPIPDGLPLETTTLDVKANFESSSDDDDMVKVYNFKLGKTLVKPLNETKTLEELTVMNNGSEEIESELSTPLTLAQSLASGTPSETSSWNFAIPISPPPNFADSKFSEAFEQDKQEQENPITPKIMERPMLNFEALKQDESVKAKALERPVSTPATPLDNIVGELSTIIQEKGLEALIKKPEESVEIESAKPNTLTNFTINSVSKSTLNKPKEVQSEQSQDKKMEMESETEQIKPTTPSTSPTSSPDEEKLYRKRNSVTSLKQRRSITRSDSFHTTAIASENAVLTKRTSSQLSLDQMAGNLNRRCSSSELSIGDTPSLLSLEIMKTILNSRKNSIVKSRGDDDEEKPVEVNAIRPSEELQFASLELKSKLYEKVKSEEINESPNEQPKENSRKIWERRIEQPAEESKKECEEEKSQKSLEAQEDSTDSKPKELPKVYRYSGPPSINFSTWNERPKVQVAIKNEGDYIFGGKSNDSTKTVPRNYRMSMPAAYLEQNGASPPPVAPKPGTIQRMGIPEKEYKVPIMVKPIQDVLVESVENKPAEVKVEQNGVVKSSSLRPVSVMSSKLITTEGKKIWQNGDIKTQRPTIEAVLKPQTQTIVNTSTSTLPRTNKRFSTPVTMPAAVQPAGPQLLRSTSIKQQESVTKISISSEESAPQAPFGQNTLRRTGLKEKILAKEEQDKQKAITASIQAAKMANNTTHTQKAFTNGEVKFTTVAKFEKPLTSAKLHLNLHKTTSVISTTGNSSNCSSNTTGNSTFSSSTTITPATTFSMKSKPQTPKSADIELTSPPKPPAPPMMINLKPVIAVKTPTLSEDPRDQLLAAIKNFNKDALKRA